MGFVPKSPKCARCGCALEVKWKNGADGPSLAIQPHTCVVEDGQEPKAPPRPQAKN